MPPIPAVAELIERLTAQMRSSLTPTSTLVGIQSGGVLVAERLHAALGLATPLASVDVSFHRDDHHLGGGFKAGGRVSHLPENVAGAHLILVDDVLYTGRTARAALNELFDYGRPGRVDLAVLIDRGGRELPIAPTWCALTLPEPLPANENLDLVRTEDGQLFFRLGKK